MENKRIIFTNESGGMSVIIPAPGATEEQCLAAVPTRPILRETGKMLDDGEGGTYPETVIEGHELVPFEIVDADEVPSDRTFRQAWFHDTTKSKQKVGVDTAVAKEVCHARRRAKRAEEFAPLDEAIAKQLPGTAVKNVEAERAGIRSAYASIQNDIDAAKTPAELSAILDREAL